MNRKHILPLALVAALCHTPIVSVMAQSPIVLNPTTATAQDFIQTYAGEMVETTNQGYYVRQLSWFKQVDGTNAPIIAQGRAIFDQMPKVVQDEIIQEYALQGLDYKLFSQTAIDFLKPVINEQPQQQTDPDAPILNIPQEQTQPQTENEQPSTEDQQQAIEQQEKTEDSKTESHEQVNPEQVQNEAGIEDLASRFHIEDGYLVNSAILGTLETPQTEVQTPTDSHVDVINENDEVKSEETQNQSEPVADNVQEESVARMDNDAQAFLNTYCVENGMVIQQATKANYSQILGGFSAWNGLSQAQRSAINAYLTSAGSVRYQTLYRQANQVRLNVPVNTTSKGNVSTSTQTDLLLWSSVTIMSGAIAVVAIEDNKKQKIFNSLNLN